MYTRYSTYLSVHIHTIPIHYTLYAFEGVMFYMYTVQGKKSMTKIDLHRFQHKSALPLSLPLYPVHNTIAYTYAQTFVCWFSIFRFVCLFLSVRVWRNTLYAFLLFGLTLKASPVWLPFIFGDGDGFLMPSLRFFSHSFRKKWRIKNTTEWCH